MAHSIAQGFSTGDNSGGYSLSSIEVRFQGGAPNSALVVQLATGLPSSTSVVATLSNPATLTNGINTFNAPANTSLDANTTYFVIVVGDSRHGQGRQLTQTSSKNEDDGGEPGFSVADESRWRAVGSTGTWGRSPGILRIRVNGEVSSDTAAPAFSSASVNGDKLTITFDEALAAASNLANTAFTVKKTPSGGSEAEVSLSNSTAPSIDGSTVVLTLATAVVPSDGSVKVSYTKPGSGSDNTIEDAAGNETVSFTDQAVTNDTVPAITISGGSAVTEGTAAEFTITADSAPGANLMVSLTVADAGGTSDFVAAANEGSKTVTIAANTNSITHSVPTVGDNTDEPNGEVTVTVDAATGYTVGSPSSASVTVNDDDEADIAPDFGTATVANQNYVVDSAITDLVLPEATGGNGALTYTLTPAPPAGLTFTASTRTLSGTPTAITAAATYTYKVTDADANTADSDADTLTFTIAVTQFGCAGSTAVGGSTVTSGGLVDDCRALLASEATLVGTGTALNWDTGTAMASWNGVTVSGGRVTQIRLISESLAGSIAKELGNLSSLTALRLASNSLTGSIPGELANLSNLRTLRLDGNRLTGSILAGLGNLSHLSVLWLYDNRLTGCVPVALPEVWL